MRFHLLLFLAIIITSCKPDHATSPSEDEQFLSSLGYEDYKEIVRHPVSLNSGLDSSQISEITFKSTEFFFDTTDAGAKIQTSFEFMNTGSKPLYILDTKVSCGCTVVQFPEEAIEPMQSGSIDIEFDTKGKSGFQQKSITVLTNSYPNEDRLIIEGYIKNNNQ